MPPAGGAMKIIFSCHVPFGLAHGGMQVQIEQTWAALERIGVLVQPLRWWDASQTGEVLHHFGRPPTSLVAAAQNKGMKVVVEDLLTGQGSRSLGQLKLQRAIIRLLQSALPPMLTGAFNWNAYRMADACLANTPWEARLLSLLFAAAPEKVHVLPNGVEEVFLESPPAERGPWLVCAATITERKRVVELAEAALAARTPLWVVGKPYADADPYAQRFLRLASQNPALLRYEGPVQDRAKLAQIHRSARGFVLLSTMETRSLSSEEAAACQCPLLLSDLPWARSVFQENASYCPVTSSRARIAAVLRQFYDQAPALKPPPRPKTWVEVAQQLRGIYETVLKTSR
jgi:hypothetical protein